MIVFDGAVQSREAVATVWDDRGGVKGL